MEHEWDQKKGERNLRKHGVEFVDAVIVFDDDRAITLPDEYPREERYSTPGMDAQRTNMKREYDLSKGKRGSVVPLPPEKIRITIRLDRDTVDHFRALVRRAHRGNYETLINDALRDHVQRPSLAQEVGKEVRSVLRDKLLRVKASA